MSDNPADQLTSSPQEFHASGPLEAASQSIEPLARPDRTAARRISPLQLLSGRALFGAAIEVGYVDVPCVLDRSTIQLALLALSDRRATMKFTLIDRILSHQPDRVVAIKQVSAAEEYLADHFPGYAVLPGVFMIEALVQAARVVIGEHPDGPHVLGQVKALKYGSFVRPGEALEVEVVRDRVEDDGSILFRGTGRVRRMSVRPAESAGSGNSDRAESEQSSAVGETAVSGRFTMRAVRRSATGERPPSIGNP